MRVSGRYFPTRDIRRSVPVVNQLIDTPYGSYDQKLVREVIIDLSTAFTDKTFEFAGSLVWWSDETATGLGTVYFRPNDMSNGRVPLVYDRGFSGIPFQRFYLTNPTAQAANTTMTLTIIQDSPSDRVGVNG